MKKFEKYGTLLTRSEAKEIKGGNGDGPDPLTPDPEIGGSGGACPTHNLSECKGQPCTVTAEGLELEGRCQIMTFGGTKFCTCSV